MGWLSRLLNWVPKEERAGIELDLRQPHWEASSPKSAAVLFRALANLIPQSAVLYLEGGDPRGDLQLFLEEVSVPEQSHVAMGTICPRPRMYHVPATRDNLLRLADYADNCAAPEIAIHVHVYKDGRVLVQWYDAFADPMQISKDLPQEKVRGFCKDLGIKLQDQT